MSRVIFFSIFFLLIFQISWAQIPTPTPVDLEYEVEMILPEKILKLGSIHSCVIDDKGAIWITSDKGLSRYDGQDVITYSINQEKGYLDLQSPSSKFTYLFYQNDSIWTHDGDAYDILVFDLATKKLLKTYKGGADRKRMTLTKKKGHLFYQIYIEPDEKMYFQCLNGNDTTTYFLQEAPDYNGIKIFEEHLWIGLEDSIVQYDLKGNLVKSFPAWFKFFDSHEKDLSGVYRAFSKYIYNKDEKTFDQIILPNVLKDEYHSIYGVGEKYWASKFLSLKIWYPEKNIIEDYSNILKSLTEQLSPATLSAEFKFAPLVYDGVIFHYTKNSIYKFTPKKKTYRTFKVQFDATEGDKSFRQITADEQGNTYALFYSDIIFKKNGESEFQKLEVKKDANFINAAYSLTAWKEKLIWNNAIIDLRTKEVDVIYEEEVTKHIEHFLEKDTLWLADWWQINFLKYDLTKDSLLLKKTFGASRDMEVSVMKLNQQTDLFWLGTNKGFYVVDKKGEVQKTFLEKELNLQIADIYDLEIAGDSIWFACKIGLGLLNKKTEEVQYFRNDISNSLGDIQPRIIYNILPENENSFFLGTSKGLCLFDKTKKQFSNLVANHSLANIEFNRNSAFKDQDGTYYFGSIHGLYAFRANDLEFEKKEAIESPELLSIHIYNQNTTTPRILDTKINDLHEVKLKSSDTNVDFDFSSPNLQKEILYKYRISELKSEWSNYMTDGKIELTTFPAGTYQMEVRAYTQAESDNFSSYFLKINKPKIWFRRGWVQLVLIALFGAAIALIMRNRFRLKLENQKRLEGLRIRISSDLHDDVGTLLSGIAMRSDLMYFKKKMDAAQGRELKELSEMSRKAMDGMRDVVWAIDSRKDKYGDLVVRMRSFAEYNFESKNIAHEFNVKNIEGESFLDPESRQNYYLIFKEAITNIIRHSNATKVVINFERSGDVYTLSIRDNGSQLKTTPSGGLGMSNMKMRAARIGAELKIENENGFLIKLIRKDR